MTESPSPSADLDLRLLRCFTVLADHQHFGRAANALHLTQSSLSRQIDRLEQQVGARLLDRTPRGSQLTEAGEVFLPLAPAGSSSGTPGTSSSRRPWANYAAATLKRTYTSSIWTGRTHPPRSWNTAWTSRWRGCRSRPTGCT